MTMRFTLMSQGKVLGYTGAALPHDDLPAGATAWHFVPQAAFELVEPIVAELTAPPALALVEDVIPTQDEYLHPAFSQREAEMERLVQEAASIHHFRLVLERYEALELELRDPNGHRVSTTSLIVSKQLVSSHTLRAYVEATDPGQAYEVDLAEPCYLLMARVPGAAAAASAA